MFTLDQIQTAYKQVKSGADFPQLVQDLKAIGITYYENFVEEGLTKYYGQNNFELHTPTKYPKMEISDVSSVEQFKHALKIHQQGQTGYLTFCKDSADSGVEKWTTHIGEMTVTYFDKKGEKLSVESISYK